MARVLVDDGAMVYVNGHPVHKFNLPGDKVYYELRPKTMMRRVRASAPWTWALTACFACLLP